jgi:putative DNA primase/helicase
MNAAKMFRKKYKTLVCVIPPNAPLSPTSKISPDQRGKTPGLRGSNGTWYGYGWLKHDPSLAECEMWDSWQSNVGLTGEYFPALDIDCTDTQLVESVRRLAEKILGAAPIRIGRAPRELLVYRTAQPFGRRAISIGDHLVEMLSAGRQYVVSGQHPSGVEYRWTKSPLWNIPPEGLSYIDADTVDRFFAELAHKLSDAGIDCELHGAGKLQGATPANQDVLLAPSIDALSVVVESVPNTNERFPDRDDYIQFGCAVKAAAGQEHETEGFAIFSEWAQRWEGNAASPEGNSPETVEADWRRMYPPFRIGWSWLVEQASGFNAAQFEFDVVDGAAPPAATREREKTTMFTDSWVVEQLLDEVSSLLRYVPETGRWHVWDSGFWAPDRKLLHEHYVRLALGRIARELEQRAAKVSGKEAARLQGVATKLQSRQALEIALKGLRSHPSLSVTVDAFDADPWKLNTPVGIVDLRTGKMEDHSPDEMCSMSVAVAPKDGEAPRWTRFLSETTDGNQDLIDFLQRLCGYALTGLTREQCFTFVWGPGGNGKSVFLDTVKGVMGDYSRTAPMDAFASARGERHPTDLAGLVGARLVTAEETRHDRQWDEARIKNLTGGGKVSARFMRQDFFEYTPTYTLVLVGNHQPELGVLDEGMRRRVQIVPFMQKPEKVDQNLMEKLQDEWPQILWWMIEGARKWRNKGLAAPKIVHAETEHYFEEEDHLAEWLSLSTEEGEWVASLELYRSWTQYCHARGVRPGSHNSFSRQMRSRGFAARRTNSQRGWVGLALLTQFGEEE